MTRTVSPALEAESFDPFHAGIYRFNKTGLLERDAFGNLDGALLDDPIHHANVFGETSAGRLESGSASHLLIGWALGEGLVPAVVTLAARDVMKDHNAVAGLELSARPRRRRRPRLRFHGRRCGARNAIRWLFS